MISDKGSRGDGKQLQRRGVDENLTKKMKDL